MEMLRRIMNGDVRMSIQERWKYSRLMQKRCQKADRSEKERLLGEAEAVTGLHRKSLIRRLHSPVQRKRRQRQRHRTNRVAVQAAIRMISKSIDYVCAERLQPNLTWLAQHLAEHGELEVSSDLLSKLGQISIPTIRRILQRLAQDQPHLPQNGPRLPIQLPNRRPLRPSHRMRSSQVTKKGSKKAPREQRDYDAVKHMWQTVCMNSIPL